MAPAFDPGALPRKRIGSGVLLRNAAGHVLLVEPTYKDRWEIPGGLVEEGESPREGAVRECREELGIDIDPGLAVCVHYATGPHVPGDAVLFVFDAGVTMLEAGDFTLPPDELSSAAFVELERLGDFLTPALTRRVLAAIEGAGTGRTIYLER